MDRLRREAATEAHEKAYSFAHAELCVSDPPLLNKFYLASRPHRHGSGHPRLRPRATGFAPMRATRINVPVTYEIEVMLTKKP